MPHKQTHDKSVRYLIPSTKRDLAQWQLDAATDQFYELAMQEITSPTLDQLIENSKTPDQMARQSPSLVYDSGWKDVSND